MKEKKIQSKMHMRYVIPPALPAIKRDFLIIRRSALHVPVPDVQKKNTVNRQVDWGVTLRAIYRSSISI